MDNKNWNKFVSQCDKQGVEILEDEDMLTLKHQGKEYFYMFTVTIDFLKEEVTQIIQGHK